jgi:hypothetical protein
MTTQMIQLVKRLVRRSLMPSRSSGKYNDFESHVMGSELIEDKLADIKFIFMHIHKCAGTSLIEALESSPNTICCASIPGDYPGRTGRNLIPSSVWCDAIKFTCIRNPYARVASAYSMFVRSLRWQQMFPTFNDFAQFLGYIRFETHSVSGPIVIEQYRNTIDNVIHHCTPYSNSKYFIDEMDQIIRLEELENEIQLLKDEYGLILNLLPHRKQTGGGGDYRQLYSDESRRLIREIYAADFERFGYVF